MSDAVKKTVNWERTMATCVAGSAALLASDNAQAAPIYSGVQDIPIGVDSSLPWDLNGDAVIDFEFENALLNPTFRALTIDTFANDAVVFAGEALALGPGVKLPGNQKFESGNPLFMATLTDGGVGGGPWFGVTNRYLGVAFDIAGATHYGWGRLSVSGDTNINTGLTATLHDWAYESEPGRSIRTGQTTVPEPTSLALLALGAAGIGAHRARRRRQTEQTEVDA